MLFSRRYSSTWVSSFTIAPNQSSHCVTKHLGNYFSLNLKNKLSNVLELVNSWIIFEAVWVVYIYKKSLAEQLLNVGTLKRHRDYKFTGRT